MSFPQGDLYNFSLPILCGPTEYGDSQCSSWIHVSRRLRIQRQVGHPQPVYELRSACRSRVGCFRRWKDGGAHIGAGIAHDFIRQDLHLNTSSVSPFRLTVIRNAVSMDDPWAGYAGGNPFPYNYNRSNPNFSPFGSYLPVPEDMKTHVLFVEPWDSASGNARSVFVGNLCGITHHSHLEWYRIESRAVSRIGPVHALDRQRPRLLPCLFHGG